MRGKSSRSAELAGGATEIGETASRLMLARLRLVSRCLTSPSLKWLTVTGWEGLGEIPSTGPNPSSLL